MRGDHRVGDRDESLRQPAREKLKKKKTSLECQCNRLPLALSAGVLLTGREIIYL